MNIIKWIYFKEYWAVNANKGYEPITPINYVLRKRILAENYNALGQYNII